MPFCGLNDGGDQDLDRVMLYNIQAVGHVLQFVIIITVEPLSIVDTIGIALMCPHGRGVLIKEVSLLKRRPY